MKILAAIHDLMFSSKVNAAAGGRPITWLKRGTKVADEVAREKPDVLLIDLAAPQLDAVNAMVLLCPPGSSEIEVRAHVGVPLDTLKSRRFQRGQGLIGWVAERGEAALVDDVANDPRYHQSDLRTRSELCVPLRVGDRVIGAVDLQSPRVGAFSNNDERLLLTVAGLFVRSMRQLQQVNPGFNPEQLLTMQLALPRTRYPEDEQRTRFFEEVLAQVTALPDVKSAAVASQLPFLGENSASSFQIVGRPPLPKGETLDTNRRTVSADYFQTLGLQLVRGRSFDHSDTAQAPRVVIINEAMARKFWPDDDPLGPEDAQRALGLPHECAHAEDVRGHVDHVDALEPGGGTERPRGVAQAVADEQRRARPRLGGTPGAPQVARGARTTGHEDHALLRCAHRR